MNVEGSTADLHNSCELMLTSIDAMYLLQMSLLTKQTLDTLTNPA